MAQKSDIHDKDFEIQFYEGLIQKKPDFVQALMALGDLYTKKRLYEKGLMIDEKLSQLRPDDPTIFYNLACSYSLLEDTNKAFRSIKQAINCGYDNFYYLEQDHDLANLRKDTRFQRYFLRIKNRKNLLKKT